MVYRKVKVAGFISSIIFLITGCSVSEEAKLAKDCKEVESKLIFYAKNRT
jgi:hypothetical protein